MYFQDPRPRPSGKVFLDGKELQFRSPSEAQACGLATVYQELSLVPNISVAENIFLGRLPMKNPGMWIGKKRMQKQKIC